MHELMYSCRRAAELSSRAMEGRLPLHQRAGLALHLAMCAGCRNFSRQIKWLRDIGRRLPEALARDERAS
jgi:predicted anti-sigma-YlaC factor YlaD